MTYVDSFASFRASVREGDITIPKVALGEPLRAECDHFPRLHRLGACTADGWRGGARGRARPGGDPALRASRRTRGEGVVPDAIPLVDLKAQHAEIADEVERGFARVCAQASFVLGPEVAAFEAAFARFSGVAHCVGVANGTDALGAGAARRRRRCGRRGDHARQHLHRDRARDRPCWRDAGARRLRSGVPPDRCRGGAGEARAAHPGDRAGPPLWPDGALGAAGDGRARGRRSPDRGRGAGAGRDAARHRRGGLRRRGGHKLLPGQEPRRLRRRGGGAHRLGGAGGQGARTR